jgi:prolyl-tRNA editing enzyme YbaK/EbsC (Cys-tRNA(Pro) deacylase)
MALFGSLFIKESCKTMRTPDDLQIYIETHCINAQLVRDIGETPTVPAAAEALGVEPERIVKTLLFLCKMPGRNAGSRQPVVVIANGERRIDSKRLAAHLDLAVKRISMASAERVLEWTGYCAGGVPPFGHLCEMAVVMDAAIEALADRDGGIIYGGGGDDHTMVRLTVPELLRVVQPQIVALSDNAPPLTGTT